MNQNRKRISSFTNDPRNRIRNRTALASSSAGINMKDFIRNIEDQNPIQKIEILYNLVEKKSESIIGFIEMNGLSYVNSWLANAFNKHDNTLVFHILQFLAHKNLDVWYSSLEMSKIGKTINSIIFNYKKNTCKQISSKKNGKILIKNKIEILSKEMKTKLPMDYVSYLHKNEQKSKISNIINCNILNIYISRSFIIDLCKSVSDKPLIISVIKYLEYRYALAIMNRWKVVLQHWKKNKDKVQHRKIRFSDECGKPLFTKYVFRKNEIPLKISKIEDDIRRSKLLCITEWEIPQVWNIPIFVNDDEEQFPSPGSKSKEKSISKDRESNELEVFYFPPNPLPNPTDLPSNLLMSKRTKTMIHLPLDSSPVIVHNEYQPQMYVHQPYQPSPMYANQMHMNMVSMNAHMIQQQNIHAYAVQQGLHQMSAQIPSFYAHQRNMHVQHSHVQPFFDGNMHHMQHMPNHMPFVNRNYNQPQMQMNMNVDGVGRKRKSRFDEKPNHKRFKSNSYENHGKHKYHRNEDGSHHHKHHTHDHGSNRTKVSMVDECILYFSFFMCV